MFQIKKTLQNRLPLTLIISKPKAFIIYWLGQKLIKLLSFMKDWCYFFIISLVCVCNAISHHLVTQWKQKLYSYNDLQTFQKKPESDRMKENASPVDKK